MRYNNADPNIIVGLMRRIDDLENEVALLRNMLTPTIPGYDKTNPPTLIELQIFFGTNDSSLNVYHNGGTYSLAM